MCPSVRCPDEDELVDAQRLGTADGLAVGGQREIDLSALADDELVGQMHNDLYDGLGDEIADGTRILLGRGWSPERVLNEALVEGMRIVGVDFRDGILFVPEVDGAKMNVPDRGTRIDPKRIGLMVPLTVAMKPRPPEAGELMLH